MSDYWSFGGVAFRRIVSGDEPQWFPRTRERTVDVIAETATRIVDEGATVFGTLSFVALCDTALIAASLEAAYGSTATLSSPTGRNGSALCVQADTLINDGAVFRVQVTFEVLS